MKVTRSRSDSALILICLLLLSQDAIAERVDPYLVTVEVANRSSAARRPALRDALAAVLVGLSGQALLVAELKGQSRLPFRDQLVQQFRYLEAPSEDGSTQLLLEARFEPKLVRNLAHSLGLPKWPLERGVTIMWLALDDGLRRALLGTEVEHEEIIAAAAEVAKARKVPLLLPLMDLDDRRQVTFSDVWGGFADHVAGASDRYGAQYLLLGRVYRSGAAWGGRWQIRDGQWVERWSVEGADVNAVIKAALEHVAEWLGQRYAVLATSDSDEILVMRLEGINSIADYGRALRYLEGLSVIQTVAPILVTPETLELAIESAAGIEVIKQALAIEQVLAPIEVGVGGGTSAFELNYRLNP